MQAGEEDGGDFDLGSYGEINAVPIYTQELTQTKVYGGADYKNVSVLEKGGAEKKVQSQKTATTAVSVETLEGSGGTDSTPTP
jgi:hypothetical protein